MVFRKKIILEIGGYNEIFKSGQDYALLIKIISHYRIQNFDEVLYKLRKHSESISIKKKEESVLFHLLAIRLVREKNGEKIIQSIREKSIRSFFDYLTIKELIFYHNSIAEFHLNSFNLSLARKEYLEIFKISPCDFFNNVNIICSFFGVPFFRIKFLILQNLENLFHKTNTII
jgi:hypothetical protein